MKKFKLRTTSCFNRQKLQIVLASTLFLSVICVDTSAQFGVALGPKAGISITTFEGTEVENIDTRSNWLGGLFLNVQLSPIITLQPELLLTQKGADYTHNDVRTNIKINYFEIPVLAKFRLPIQDVVFPHILLGPNFAYRTNLDYTRRETQSGSVITTDDDDIRKTDVGAVIGAGIDFQTPESGLFFTVDGRYGFSFNDVDRSDNSIELKNAGWSFALGVGFLLTR